MKVAKGDVPDTLEDSAVNYMSGTTHTKERGFERKDEPLLSFDEWFQAWGCLMDLIRDYLPEELDAWVVHYMSIWDAPSRTENWTTWIQYDIEIRYQATHTEIDPSMFHQSVWEGISQQTTRDQIVAVLRQDMNLIPPHQSTQRFCGTAFNQSKATGTNKQKAATATASKCFICGSTDQSHSSLKCKTTTNVKGKPTYLKAPVARIRRDAAGNTYCFTWNGHSGECAAESGNDCTHGLHACSLCGKANHNVQACHTV